MPTVFAREPRTAAAPDPTGLRAFEREALRWLPDVARFARALARDAADADDLVQETYLRAYRGWHTFRPGTDARRWLFQICKHAFLRGRERERRVVPSVAGPDRDPALETLAAVALHERASREGLDTLADRVEVGPAIRAALAALPAHHRAVVVLVDVADYGYTDAAAVLGVPVGTVRSRLFRARRVLQAALLAHARDAGLAPAVARVPDGARTAPTRVRDHRDHTCQLDLPENPI